MNWWHEHKLTYHILSIIARDIMVVPVSIVSSESCFSLTGRVIEERRRQLLQHTVEMLTVGVLDRQPTKGNTRGR
jgi:hypothetical protein